MGLILGAFFWTYAIFQLVSGWLVDRLGPRIMYSVSTIWWSICLVGGMLFSSVIALAVIVPSAAVALALLAVSYASLTFAAASIWSLPADVVGDIESLPVKGVRPVAPSTRLEPRGHA